MSDALEDQAVGTIGEIFDGDPPHHPRGAPAQAWSVACTLDAWRLLKQAEQANHTRKSEQTAKPPGGSRSHMPQEIDAEKRRIEESRKGAKNWRRWGPYLSERQWGTVREDYSPGGTAWDYLTHDQARSRAYRWGEDGIAGFSDDRQLLCLSIALWNGRDPILKERLFGLTNGEGSHGEDVKELYYYLDAVPSYAYARMLYKLPQAAYPYQWLIEENARRRGSAAMEFELIDTGIFDDDRYFDIEVEYAKAEVDDVLMRTTIHNRGPEQASIHVLPQAWFRNIWSWSAGTEKPSLKDQGGGVVLAQHAGLGAFLVRFEHADRLLFCENESNFARLFGGSAAQGHFKDAFHEYVVNNRAGAVNPAGEGTKVAGLYVAKSRPRAAPRFASGSPPVSRGRVASTASMMFSLGALPKRMNSMPPCRKASPTRTCGGYSVRLSLECCGASSFITSTCSVARWRSDSSRRPREPEARAQQRLASLHGRRSHVDAGQVGISLVRGLGPRLPLRHAFIDRCRFCEKSAPAAMRGLADASERRAAGL